MTKWNELVKESPYVKAGASLADTYVLKELQQPIEQGIILNKFEKVIDNIYTYMPSKIEVIYVYTQDNNLNNIIGAVKFIEFTTKNESYLVAMCTKKFIEKYSNVMLKIYSIASKYFKIGIEISIMSDGIQTEPSSIVWKKWVLTPSKYGIKDIKIIDIRKGEIPFTSIEDIWSSSEYNYNNIRVVVKFK